jgi:hypothetical protein
MATAGAGMTVLHVFQDAVALGESLADRIATGIEQARMRKERYCWAAPRPQPANDHGRPRRPGTNWNSTCAISPSS